MAAGEALAVLQRTVWDARLPLEIRLAASESRTYDTGDPYLVRQWCTSEAFVDAQGRITLLILGISFCSAADSHGYAA